MNDALQLKNTRYELILPFLGICLFAVGIFLSNSAPWWIPGCSKDPHHWYHRWNSMLSYLLIPAMCYVPVRLSLCRHYFIWTVRWGITTLSLIPYGIAMYLSPLQPFTDDPLYDKPFLRALDVFGSLFFLQLIAALPVFLLFAYIKRKREITKLPWGWSIPLSLPGILPIILPVISFIVVMSYLGYC